MGISPYVYGINNPIIVVDIDGNDIYVTTKHKTNFDFVKDIILKTTTGQALWNSYAKNGSLASKEDIYINTQRYYSWSEKHGGGWWYDFWGVIVNQNYEYEGWTIKNDDLKSLGMLSSSGTINFTQQHYDNIFNLKDLNSFNGANLSASTSQGKDVFIITLNENLFNKPIQDITVDDVMKAALATYHEMFAHVKNRKSTTQGQDDHSAFFGNGDRSNPDKFDPNSPAGVFWQELQNNKSSIASELSKLQNANSSKINNSTQTGTTSNTTNTQTTQY